MILDVRNSLHLICLILLKFAKKTQLNRSLYTQLNLTLIYIQYVLL